MPKRNGYLHVESSPAAQNNKLARKLHVLAVAVCNTEYATQIKASEIASRSLAAEGEISECDLDEAPAPGPDPDVSTRLDAQVAGPHGSRISRASWQLPCAGHCVLAGVFPAGWDRGVLYLDPFGAPSRSGETPGLWVSPGSWHGCRAGSIRHR